MRPLTRSCFLLPLLGRLFLLALPFLLGMSRPSLWSPFFPLHAVALIPLTLAKVRLSLTLTLSLVMIWYSGLTALFLFRLAKAAPALLPIAFSVALRPLFPFQQAQYAQVFPLKPAPLCLLFAGLGSTTKSASSLLFSSYLTLVLSSPPCPFLRLFFCRKLCGRSGRNCLLSPSVLSGYNGSHGTHFSRGTGESFSIEKLVLPHHARCVLSRLHCNGHSLLLSSYLFRIGRIGNPSCSACGHSSQDTSHLILHCPATDSLSRSLFGDSLSLYDLWSRSWRVARLLGLHGLPPCPHPSDEVG